MKDRGQVYTFDRKTMPKIKKQESEFRSQKGRIKTKKGRSH